MDFEEKSTCLWHAFNVLDDKKTGAVPKSKLKVLTQNIGTSVGIFKIEEQLESCHESATITFPEYLSFLKTSLFHKLKKTLASSNFSIDQIDQVCWFICCKSYLLVRRQNVRIDTENAFRLWRIFNTVVEVDDDNLPVFPVTVHAQEIGLIVKKFCSIVMKEFDSRDFASISEDITHFSFEQFLLLMESPHCQKLDDITLSSAITELFDQHINEVIKKGFLTKNKSLDIKSSPERYKISAKFMKAGGWRERWFVLQPASLRYFTTLGDREPKGEVAISGSTKVEVLPDKSNMKPNRFLLISDRNYEISAPDVVTRSEWVNAIKSVIELAQQKTTPLRRLRLQRRQDRQMQEEEKKKRLQEAAKILDTIEQLQQLRDLKLSIEQSLDDKEKAWELEKEQAQEKLKLLKEKTQEVEEKLEEETSQRLIDQKRLEEMQEMQKEQKQLMEELKQAKQDEEIVRNLQGRILEEQFAKSEELEKIKNELENRLHEIEGLRDQDQTALAEKKNLVQELEEEKKSIDERHKNAEIQLAEATKISQDLQLRLKEKERPVLRLARLLKDDNQNFEIVTHRGPGSIPKQLSPDSHFKVKANAEEEHDVAKTQSEKSTCDCNDIHVPKHPADSDGRNNVVASTECHQLDFSGDNTVNCSIGSMDSQALLDDNTSIQSNGSSEDGTSHVEGDGISGDTVNMN